MDIGSKILAFTQIQEKFGQGRKRVKDKRDDTKMLPITPVNQCVATIPTFTSVQTRTTTTIQARVDEF